MARGYTYAKNAGTWKPLTGLYLKKNVTSVEGAPVWDLSYSVASQNVRVSTPPDLNVQLALHNGYYEKYLDSYFNGQGAGKFPPKVWLTKWIATSGQAQLTAPAPNYSPVIGAFGINVVYLSTWTRTLTSSIKIPLAGISTFSYQTNKGTEAGWGQIPENGEDLVLEWSLDGSTWTFLNSTSAKDAPADTWVTQTVTIPEAAKVPNGVYLRFKQTGSSGNYENVDTWAFTNIIRTFSGIQSTWVPVKTAWKKSSNGVWEQVYPTPQAIPEVDLDTLTMSTIDGYTSAEQTVSISNNGTGTLYISSATVSTNSNYSVNVNYTGLGGSETDPACSIDPGATKSFTVSITGATPGQVPSYITFTTNVGAFGSKNVVVNINGTSLPRKPRASINRTSVTWTYDSILGPTSIPFVLRNTGELDLVVSSITSGSRFSNATHTITPGSSWSFSLTYSQRGTGGFFKDNITINSNSDLGAITIPVDTTEIHHGTDALAAPRGAWTVPPGIYSITVTMLGGGGGGGGSDGSEEPLKLGAGGSGGATVVKTFAVQPGQAFNYTIGTGGGGGGISAAGGAGSASTFGTYSANGGAGGAPNQIYWGPSSSTGGGSPTGNGGAGGGYNEGAERGLGGNAGSAGSISVTY